MYRFYSQILIEMKIIPDGVELKDLKQIRNYFGENDRTIFEHKAFAVIQKLINHFEEHDGKYYIDLYAKKTLLSKKLAIQRCIENFDFIRHNSFEGTLYIKNVNGELKWSDNSKVDINQLPDGYYGKYLNEIYNFESF